jgi:hypothetical protein
MQNVERSPIVTLDLAQRQTLNKVTSIPHHNELGIEELVYKPKIPIIGEESQWYISGETVLLLFK